jgi:hypothetical protein
MVQLAWQEPGRGARPPSKSARTSRPSAARRTASRRAADSEPDSARALAAGGSDGIWQPRGRREPAGEEGEIPLVRLQVPQRADAPVPPPALLRRSYAAHPGVAASMVMVKDRCGKAAIVSTPPRTVPGPPTMVRVRPRPPGMGSSIACSNPSSGESCSGSAIIGLASRPPGTTASRVGASGNGSAHWISQPRLPRGGVTTHDNDTRKWLPSSPCKSAYQASQWLGSPSSRGRRSEPADSAGSRVISAMRLRIHSQQRVRAVTATNTKMTGDTRWRLE